LSAGAIIGCPSGGLLALPKPKLAPIASCETLSESFDQHERDRTQLIGGGGTSSGGSSLGSSPVGSLSDDSNSGSWYQTPTGGSGINSATASTPGQSSLISGGTTAITITTSSDSAFSSLHRRSATSSPRTSIDDQLGSSGAGTPGTVGMAAGGRCGGCGTILVIGSAGSSGGSYGVSGSGGGGVSLLVPSGSHSGLSATTSCDTLMTGYRQMSAAASSDTLVPGSPSVGSSLSGSPTTTASTNSVASTTAVNLSSNAQLQQSSASQAAAQQQQSSSLKRQLAALLLVNFRGGSGGSSGRKSRGSGGSSSAAAAASATSTSSSSAASLQSSHQLNALALSPATSPKFGQGPLLSRRHGVHHQAGVGYSGGSVSPWELSPDGTCLGCGNVVNVGVGPSAVLSPTTRRATSPSPLRRSPINSPKLCRAPSPISYSYSSPNIITNLVKPRPC